MLTIYLGRSTGGSSYSFSVQRIVEKIHKDSDIVVLDRIDQLKAWKRAYPNLIVLKTNHLKDILKSLWLLVRLINKNNDIYIPMGHPIVSAFILLYRNRKRFIYTIHDIIPHSTNSVRTKFLNFIVGESKIFKYCSARIVLSHSAQETLRLERSLDSIVLSHPIVSKDFFCQDTNHTLSHYKKYKYNLLFFGRIDEYKGLDNLIDIFIEMLEENLSVSLTIAGAGSGFNDKKILECSHYYKYNYWIPTDQIFTFFSSDVITVLPYLDASQSGVISLAWLNNSIVVASRHAGLDEQLGGGKYGLLFDVNSSEQFKECLKASRDDKVFSKISEEVESLLLLDEQKLVNQLKLLMNE